MVRLKDLILAEELVEEAEAEYRRLNDDTSQWGAYESLDKRGMRVLNIQAGHFERRDAARARVTAAQQQLLATKREFLRGVLDAEV